MYCEWCAEESSGESQDHVFSRLLGGRRTEGLWVYACPKCRGAISKAEDEVAHRSHVSVLRFAKGITPRHPERPTSGLVESRVNFVKDPETGRYSVFSLRLGEEHPEILPALEFDFESDKFYFHGSGAESAVRLRTALCSLFDQEPDAEGKVGDVKVWCLEEFGPEIAADPDFNPRVYRLPRGHLQICARNQNEALALARVLAALSERPEFREFVPDGWHGWSIPARTPHNVVFVFDAPSFDRVVVKIALGMIGAFRRRSQLPRQHCILHDAVRGEVALLDGTVNQLEPSQAVRANHAEQLFAIVANREGATVVYVGIYGECYSVSLPEALQQSDVGGAFGAACLLDEVPRQYWLSDGELGAVLESIQDKG